MEDSTHYDDTLPTPDLQELQQDVSEHLATVPVRLEDEVLTHELPSRYAQMWTDAVGIDYVNIVAASLKHKRIVLIASAAVTVNTQQTGRGYDLPAGVQLVMTHAQAVNVKAQSGTANVSVLVESWAD